MKPPELTQWHKASYSCESWPGDFHEISEDFCKNFERRPLGIVELDRLRRFGWLHVSCICCFSLACAARIFFCHLAFPLKRVLSSGWDLIVPKTAKPSAEALGYGQTAELRLRRR
jgi:hypothetical protein